MFQNLVSYKKNKYKLKIILEFLNIVKQINSANLTSLK